MCRKLNIMIIILLIISICIPLNSYASSNGFSEFKSCPTISANASTSGLKDITIKVTDNYGIQSVELKELDLNGKNPKEVKFSKTNKKSEKEHIYTLSHSKLLKGKKRIFSINIVNTKGYCYNSTFKINVKSKKVNKKTVKYYSVDAAPRVKDFSISGSRLTFTVRDTGVYKTIQVTDYNNNKNIAATVNNVKPGEVKSSIDMTNFKTDQNGFYNIKITATENKSGYRLASNYELSFKLNTQNNSSSSGTTTESPSSSSSEITPETNITAAQKPTSESQLKLYNTSNSNSNPRYLKSPVTGKTEKVQSFAITDMGTSNETIWYAFQTYKNNKYLQTLINAYRNNKRVYSAALNYGGEGQGVDIDKIGSNTYSIYCQGMSKKSIYQYNVSTNSKYATTYDKYNVAKKGVNYKTTMEVSVDYSSGYAIATSVSNRKVRVYKLKNNYNETFSNSNKINEFQIAHPSWIQGGDLCGKYYYFLYGAYASNGSKKTYIYCYDITTGKLQWKTELALGNRVRSLLKTDYKNLEPEGIKVYYYKGSYKIFVGFKVNNYRSAILYFDC